MTDLGHRDDSLEEQPCESRLTRTDERIACRLARERPVLSRASEARIRRKVLAAARRRARPPRLRWLIGAYATSGLLLLSLAAIGLAGDGPLAF